jgi:hypothetical protein
MFKRIQDVFAGEETRLGVVTRVRKFTEGIEITLNGWDAIVVREDTLIDIKHNGQFARPELRSIVRGA